MKLDDSTTNTTQQIFAAFIYLDSFQNIGAKKVWSLEEKSVELLKKRAKVLLSSLLLCLN